MKNLWKDFVVFVGIVALLGATTIFLSTLVAAEEHIFGTDLTDKPWSGEACQSLANHMVFNAYLRKLRADKRLVFEEIDKMLEEDPAKGEVLRELSNAWDDNRDPKEWFVECVAKANAERT